MNILGYNFDLFDFTQPIAHLALITLVVLLTYWYRRPPNSPPGPRGIPLFGVSVYVGKYIERTLAKWKNNYGSIMSVRLGLRDILVLNDFESINQVRIQFKIKLFSYVKN